MRVLTIVHVTAWLSFFVALIALVQVWLVEIWRRFFRRGSVDIVETGRIEVGFSNFGPTLSLYGTLRAVHHDHFVSSITLVVTRERDGATHDFRWEAFRSGASNSTIELPAAFLITTSEPHRYGIVFVDPTTQAEVDAILAPIRQAWVAEVQGHNPPLATPAEVEAFYNNEFMPQPLHAQAHADLQRALYWNPGRYALEMTVHTSRPTAPFTRTWAFVLTDENLASLRLNAIPTLRETCGRTAQYNFAYPDYQPRGDDH
jgi:hypothetical protein